MAITRRQYVLSPVELLLGALSVVAYPLARGERGEELSETAQFYGFEDWGGEFRNVGPRISQLTVRCPTARELGCVVELTYDRLVLPGAFARACGRWATGMGLAPSRRHEWSGKGLVLTLDATPYRIGGGRVIARLAPLEKPGEP